jgi:phosphatidate cytidylyltransferase
MKKIIQRLLLFIISVPLISALVLFLPQKNHLAVNIALILFSALGAGEFAAMLNKKKSVISRPEAYILGLLGPAAMTAVVSFGIGFPIFCVCFVGGLCWLLLSRTFASAKKFEGVLDYIPAGFAVMLYPGMFLIWIILMTRIAQAGQVILVFLLMVIANDSVAWAAGMLFGKNNRGIIPASPNKSLAGFIGGSVASVLVGIGAIFFAPGVFAAKAMPSLWGGLILGLVSAIAASLGDLAESVMKRSSDIKDSGSIIPGRGGVLDSIDSIAFAAPVYYGLYQLLFV